AADVVVRARLVGVAGAAGWRHRCRRGTVLRHPQHSSVNAGRREGGMMGERGRTCNGSGVADCGVREDDACGWGCAGCCGAHRVYLFAVASAGLHVNAWCSPCSCTTSILHQQ
ncbi:hypothetical protein TcCL_NonESM13267, partial [Trypanosoma cruzi]